VPPRYSALKLNGRPLYAYARAGEEVDPAPRTVVIHELALVSWTDPTAVVLRMRCSKGTYVRSLAFDLGRALGTGAHLTALRRTRSGPFRIDEAHPLDTVETAPLIGLSRALGHLPTMRAGSDAARSLEQGKRVPWTALEPALEAPSTTLSPPQGRFQILRPDGTLLAVAEVRDDDTLRTLRVFN
jgi:tRNA pseudouridine55 synthase